MNILLKKFGTTLVSRQAGREAYNAFKPNLELLKNDEKAIIDFSDVITFTPSWGDEFLTPLLQLIGDRLILHNTENPSVLATVTLLEEIHKIKFKKD